MTGELFAVACGRCGTGEASEARTLGGESLGTLCPACASRGRSVRIGGLTILTEGGESLADECDRLLREDRERRRAAAPPMPDDVRRTLAANKHAYAERRRARKENERKLVHAISIPLRRKGR